MLSDLISPPQVKSGGADLALEALSRMQQQLAAMEGTRRAVQERARTAAIEVERLRQACNASETARRRLTGELAAAERALDRAEAAGEATRADACQRAAEAEAEAARLKEAAAAAESEAMGLAAELERERDAGRRVAERERDVQASVRS
jgi:chromosome segregation ATPase